MEKSIDFVDIQPLTRLVHQGFEVLWLCGRDCRGLWPPKKIDGFRVVRVEIAAFQMIIDY